MGEELLLMPLFSVVRLGYNAFVSADKFSEGAVERGDASYCGLGVSIHNIGKCSTRTIRIKTIRLNLVKDFLF